MAFVLWGVLEQPLLEYERKKRRELSRQRWPGRKYQARNSKNLRAMGVELSREALKQCESQIRVGYLNNNKFNVDDSNLVDFQQFLSTLLHFGVFLT